jgi:hypothetical protein
MNGNRRACPPEERENEQGSERRGDGCQGQESRARACHESQDQGKEAKNDRDINDEGRQAAAPVHESNIIMPWARGKGSRGTWIAGLNRNRV